MVELINWKYWNIFEWGHKAENAENCQFFAKHAQETGFQYMGNQFLQLIFEKTLFFGTFWFWLDFWLVKEGMEINTWTLESLSDHQPKILENSRSTRVWPPLTELWLCSDESFFDVFGPDFFPEKVSKKENKHIFFGILVRH